MSKKKNKEKKEKAIILPKEGISYIYPSGKWSKTYAEKIGHLINNPFIREHDFIFLCRGKIQFADLFSKSYGIAARVPDFSEKNNFEGKDQDINRSGLRII